MFGRVLVDPLAFWVPAVMMGGIDVFADLLTDILTWQVRSISIALRKSIWILRETVVPMKRWVNIHV
jgi:hypothetical protein